MNGDMFSHGRRIVREVGREWCVEGQEPSFDQLPNGDCREHLPHRRDVEPSVSLVRDTEAATRLVVRA